MKLAKFKAGVFNMFNSVVSDSAIKYHRHVFEGRVIDVICKWSI